MFDELDAPVAKRRIKFRLTSSGIAYEAFKELSFLEKICSKTTSSEWELFHDAFRGGFNYSKPGTYRKVKMADKISMFSHKMRDYPMPVGSPFRCEEKNNYKFYIINILVRYDLKPGMIACIPMKDKKYNGVFYKESTNGNYENLILSKYDFEILKTCYDIDYQFIWCFGWQTITGLFKKYVDYFFNIKNNSTGVKRQVAKDFLTHPYGKTAVSGEMTKRSYYLDDNGVVASKIIDQYINPNILQYLAISIAITSSSFYDLMQEAFKIGLENVVYMDTDSIKYIDKNQDIKYTNDLGGWKLEGSPIIFKTLSTKKYIYYENNVINIVCSGFKEEEVMKALNYEKNKKISLTEAKDIINKFNDGLEVESEVTDITKGGRYRKKIVKVISSKVQVYS